jgi:hypothetical protein
LKEDYVGFMEGEKGCERLGQKEWCGELNVAEWYTKKEANNEQPDIHFYFTNLVAEIKELKKEMKVFKEEMKTDNKPLMRIY